MALLSQDEKNNSDESQNQKNLPHLPHEILAQIISRIPATTILRCCHPFPPLSHYNNEFDAIISNPLFPRFFQSHNLNTSFLAFNGSTNSSTLIEYNYDNNDQHRKVEYNIDMMNFINRDMLSKSIVELLASCNGCILVGVMRKVHFALRHLWRPLHSLRLHLVNPISQRRVDIPKSPNASAWQNNNFALGYSSKTDVFKVVRVFYNIGPSNILIAEVFTIGGGAHRGVGVGGRDNDHNIWKTITKAFTEEFTTISSDAVALNGGLHWLVDSSNLILKFDIDEEKFELIHAPRSHAIKVYYDLGVLDGLLYVGAYASNNYAETEIWMMKEYGVNDSWSYFTVIDNKPLDKDGFELIKVLENGKILMLWHSFYGEERYYLDVYDPKQRDRDDQSSRVEILEGLDKKMRQRMIVTYFVPSFLSLRHI